MGSGHVTSGTERALLGLVVRVLVVFLFALAGCPSVGSLSGNPTPDDDSDPLPAQARCVVDEDCGLLAPTCCECPTFAVPTDSPVFQACQDVDCPELECAENVTARCNVDVHQCELACVPAECAATDCPEGYVIDEGTSCLACACAMPEQLTCQQDLDCVQTRADCCGCANGGKDTAVTASEQPAYDAMLECDAEPQCPGINACEPGTSPQCVQGSCELLAGGLPAKACGRPDLPGCANGEVCTVNVNDQANMHGVGICQPPL